MQKLIGLLAMLFAIVMVTPSSFGQCYGYPMLDSNEMRIYAHSTCATVYNNPPNPTAFTIDQPRVMTKIATYHWNDGQGTQAPGTIMLMGPDWKMYGPWQAEGMPGMGGVPNAYWLVTLPGGVELPPGKYSIIDSEPETWSQNAETDNCGIVSVVGY